MLGNVFHQWTFLCSHGSHSCWLATLFSCLASDHLAQTSYSSNSQLTTRLADLDVWPWSASTENTASNSFSVFAWRQYRIGFSKNTAFYYWFIVACAIVFTLCRSLVTALPSAVISQHWYPKCVNRTLILTTSKDEVAVKPLWTFHINTSINTKTKCLVLSYPKYQY